jgi:hypothetical protein
LLVLSQEDHTKASAFVHKYIDVDISILGGKVQAECLSTRVITDVCSGL